MKLSIRYNIILFFLVVNINLCLCQVNTIPGLVLWLTGDSIHKVGINSIDTVYDLSPIKNHAVQILTNQQPTSLVSSLNSHKTILFDGNNDYLNFNELNNIRTVFWVLKESPNIPANYRPLLGHNTAYNFHRGDDSTLWYITLTDNGIINGTTKLNFNQVNGLTTSLNSKYTVLSLTTTNNVIADNFSNDRTSLNLNRYWNGELAELIIYNQQLTPLEVIQVEDYLNSKYTTAILLPNDFSLLNNFCDTIITAIGTFDNYLWSNGATTPTISVNASGKYWVNTTNIFGKISSDTILVNFPDYHKPLQNNICTGNTLLWDTDLPKSDYSFIWQDNTTTDSVFTITQSGNYFVTITDLLGCSITTETVIITQDNFATTASLGPDLPICSGNSITLTSGASPTNSYIWSTGSINDSLLITNTGQYSVIVTNTNNCIAKDTINIAIQGLAPIANFTTSIGCVNSSVAFINSSLAPTGNTFTLTSWNFGDSNTSPLFNPSHTYTNTGTYTVSVLVQTDANCSQSISKIVNINPVPTASFVSGIACQNDSTTFFNQSTSALGFPISSSYWNFGDLTTSNLTSPKHVFANPVIYTTKLLVTNNVGCKDSLYKTVNVQAEVKANFTNSPACTNTATHFQSTSIIPSSGSPTYAWNFGNSTANTTTPIKTYTNSGVYYVTLTVDGTNGCTSTITKLLNVYLPPIANFSISSFCAKDTVTILNLSSPQSGMLSSYNWKLNATNFSAIQSPTLSLTNAGNYSVRLTTINSFGCKDSTTNSLTVFPLPVVDFITNPTAYYYINEPVNFVPSITNASLYSWNINSIPTSTIQSPTETFNSEGAYTTSLNIKDQQGCKGSKTKNINVFKRSLDLAILNVTTAKDADGFISVVADLANYGSVPINSFNVHYQTSDAGNIKENWTGSLLPNSFYVYTFNAKSASLQSNTNNITCVEIETVNSIVDDVTTNNSFCNTLNTDDISVSNPIPNPSSGDIKLPIITNKDIDYTIVIYNSTGQIQSEEITKKIVAGLHFISLPTSSYARGSYIIKIIIDEKIFIKKFIKIDNQ